VNYLLIFAMVILLALVFLPFWLVAPRTSKDKHIIKDVLHPGNFRYVLTLPEGYDGVDPVPLVVVLHFSGHGFPYYGELLLTDMVEPALRRLNAIFVAPDCPAKDWTQSQSEQMILFLLDYLKDKYTIDPARIMITGFSMGGIGAWHLGNRFPDQFALVLPMAAAPPEEILENGWTLPVYILHGRDDELFPVVNTTRAVVQLEAAGVDIHYRILEKVTHYQTHKFHAPLQDAVSWILNHWRDDLS